MLAGGVALGRPSAGIAQQMPVIGFLGSATPESWAPRLRQFNQGLADAGFADGRNVRIEYRWAEGRNDRLPAMAADLVARQVSVIAAVGSTPAAMAAKAATATIPIVFEIAGNPVEIGLVSSLARPGGNITGITTLNSEVEPKRLELLHELLPAAATIAVVINPTSPAIAASTTAILQATALRLGVRLIFIQAGSEADFDSVFSTIAERNIGAVVFGADALFTSRLDQLAALALQHRLASIYQFREFAAAGGLLSYGASLTETFNLAGNYTGRILKGEKPAELPVQQATKVELIINLKTAKTLGLTMPLSLLGRADEVIE